MTLILSNFDITEIVLAQNTQLLNISQMIGEVAIVETSEKIATAINM